MAAAKEGRLPPASRAPAQCMQQGAERERPVPAANPQRPRSHPLGPLPPGAWVQERKSAAVAVAARSPTHHDPQLLWRDNRGARRCAVQGSQVPLPGAVSAPTPVTLTHAPARASPPPRARASAVQRTDPRGRFVPAPSPTGASRAAPPGGRAGEGRRANEAVPSSPAAPRAPSRATALAFAAAALPGGREVICRPSRRPLHVAAQRSRNPTRTHHLPGLAAAAAGGVACRAGTLVLLPVGFRGFEAHIRRKWLCSCRGICDPA
uniref:translation initiation factor IF-2-like n=1 Tax=Callithrix jacchus TaxID=9483 RepID=UPI0023DD1170|nr:translation initiation factor IF-2-like [Callithrix jacchus]